MCSGVGSGRVSDAHLKLIDEFARSIVADEPGYSYGKATYVQMVYDAG